MSIDEAMEYYKDPREGDFRKGLKRTWKDPKPSAAEKGKSGKGRQPKSSKRSETEPGPSGSSSMPGGSSKKSTSPDGSKPTEDRAKGKKLKNIKEMQCK